MKELKQLFLSRFIKIPSLLIVLIIYNKDLFRMLKFVYVVLGFWFSYCRNTVKVIIIYGTNIREER